MTADLSASADAVGAVLNGQWKLVRLVGEGGLAAVYEAHGLQGQGTRAVKLLHPEFRGRQSVMDRFYAEAKTSYSLRHPHIAAAESYALAEDGSPYIVMELLDGMSLESLLALGRPLPVGEVATIAVGILQALSVAHARGIVHRDLKPANLFLLRDARGDWFPKVLDFGVAKVMDEAGGMGSKTRTGALLGTPGYMSPEQVKDAKNVDARTDLWAVGVVLYEMLTCRHPFDVGDKLARMVAVLKDAPRSVTDWDPALVQWDAFFQRALAKSPSERFESAQQMAQAVQALADQAAAAGAPAGSPATTRATGAVVAGAVDAVASGPVVVVHSAASVPAHAQLSAASPVIGYTPMSASAGPVPTLHNTRPTPAPASMTTPPVRPDDQSWPLELGPASLDTGGRAPQPAAPLPPAGAGRTQISGDEPPGPPTHVAPIPQVHVVTAADEDPPALVWWAVLLLAIACLALGFTVGYVLGAR